MKKIGTIIALVCLCVGLACAKSLPKIKEANFGKDSYVQGIISGYGLERDLTAPASDVYDRAERYVSGDNFVEIAEKEYERENVKYVGMYINGTYTSRTWYEVQFPETTLDAALYENSKTLSAGGSDGAYALAPDAELYYIFESLSFRTAARNALKSKYPEKTAKKDAELSAVFYAFYTNKNRDETTFKDAVKELQSITDKYKK